MFIYQQLTPLDALRFGRFTFPAYRHQLLSAGTVSTLAIGADLVQHHSVGLALAEINSVTATATLLSLYVAPAWRGRGIASELLTRMEDELLQRGLIGVAATYAAGNPTTIALERLFVSRGWAMPEPYVYLIRGMAEQIAHIPWIRSAWSPPQECELFPWQDLTSDEREDILERKRREDWYPDELGPFFEEDKLEFATSLGLRHRGCVVGWQINHRIEPDLHRFTRTWLRRDWQSSGRGLILMVETARRYLATGIPRAVMCIDARNTAMLRFFERRIAAYTTGIQEVRFVEKKLVANPRARYNASM